MLKNYYLVAKIRFDTAENEPSKVWTCMPGKLYSSASKPGACKKCPHELDGDVEKAGFDLPFRPHLEHLRRHVEPMLRFDLYSERRSQYTEEPY